MFDITRYGTEYKQVNYQVVHAAGIVTLTEGKAMHSTKRENELHIATSPTSLCCRVHTGDVVPYQESPIAILLMGGRFQAMTMRIAMVPHGAMD